MVALSDLHIRFTFKSLSPAVPNASFALNYFTTFTTMDFTDISDLITKIVATLTVTPPGATQPPANFIAPIIARGGGNLPWEVYDVSTVLSGGRMGSPVLVGAASMPGTPGSTATPQETAAVITMQAPYGTDVEFGPGTRPRARDRGRIYFGPLDGSALSLESTTNRCQITSGARTCLAGWMKSLTVITSSPHTVVWNLGVWSRRNAGMKSLQEVWVDDNPDTQRRRGGTYVNKTIVGVP